MLSLCQATYQQVRVGTWTQDLWSVGGMSSP